MPPPKNQPDSPQATRLIHVRLKSEIHKRLRIRVAEEDVSIQDWVAAQIESGLAAPVHIGSAKAEKIQ